MGARAENPQKKAEEFGNRDALEFAEISYEHRQHCEAEIKLSMRMIDSANHVIDRTMKGQKPDEEIAKSLQVLAALGGKNPVATYTNLLHKAIAGVRESEFMQYCDPNLLSRHADQLGFDLIDRASGNVVQPVVIDIEAQDA